MMSSSRPPISGGVRDPRSTANAGLTLAERADLLVVGAGPAGLAAAIHAAGQGKRVVLVDENPVPAATMGDDIPLHFGQRMSGAVRNLSAMTEALVAGEPMLEAAFEAGVDVRLGTVVWGLYANGATVGWLPGKVAGLSDGAQSTMLGFDAAVVATGRRDMGLAFPGWELPGVMGATAAERLARLGALDARRAVMLGTSAEALSAALAMQRAGVEIVAVVEQAPAPIGPASLLEQLQAPLFAGHVIARAEGKDGVETVTLAALDGDGRRIPNQAALLGCDTVVLGVGAVPVIELTDAIGCRNVFSIERGGHVPETDANQATSIPGIYAAGDCAGVWAGKTLDRGIAEAEGRRAAAHAIGTAAEAGSSTPDPLAYDFAAYRMGWVKTAVVDADGAAHVCQCESVSARDILEVRPPAYLKWPTPLRNDPDLTALLGNGPPSPDQVKRLTRAGMGLCQGRRCREQVGALLALGGQAPLSEVPLGTYRAPVRPLPLGLAGTVEEPEAMTEHWDIWFGIPGQVRGHWDIPPLAAPKAGSEA